MICYKCLKEVYTSDSTHNGLHETCFKEWYKLSKLADFKDIALRTSESNAPNHKNSDVVLTRFISSFFQGKFKKYSATLEGIHYILKVQEKDYPELPATEFLSNQLAKDLGLSVPDFYLINLQGKVPTFVTKNFISKNKTENLIHIYHFIKEDQSYSCETLLNIILEKTQSLGEVKKFIMMCLFDSLIGNHDRHGRNIALIQQPNMFSLAPIYDNPSYLGIEMEDLLLAQHEPTGRISTIDIKNPEIKDYIYEFIRLGYSQYVKEFFSKVSMSKIETRINQSFISHLRKEAIKNLIGRRYKVMCHEITHSN